MPLSPPHSPPLYAPQPTAPPQGTAEHEAAEGAGAQEGFLLNLSPLPARAGFLSSTALEGELQVKLLVDHRHRFQDLSLAFAGHERNGHEHLQLTSHSATLWTAAPAQPSPPSQTPFRIALPRHLPECIHLPNSHGINYSLTATLTYHRLNHHHPPVPRKASLTIPIHIPACPDHPPQAHQAFSLSPVEISTLQPTPIFLTISHTLLRHAEPLALQIRIPPPTEQLVTDKGLQLRSVRAELRRHIRPRSAPEQQVTTVLAISGKSCRFSSSRAVFLRLRLHSCLASTRGRAGTVGARHGEEEGLATEREGVPRCPTVSQTTGLFEVSFSVAVRVQLSAGDGARQDVELAQAVGVEPDRPASPSQPVSGKAREALLEEAAPESDSPEGPGPAPTYLETELQASTSQLTHIDLLGPLLDWHPEEEQGEEEEEEYDGYESFSARAAHDGPAPPTIDEDESPPPAPDTPPEGLQLQPPIRVLPDSDLITLPDLARHLHHLAGDCGPFAPPDDPRSAGAPPPIEADPGCRPPAYAPGCWPPQKRRRSNRPLTPPTELPSHTSLYPSLSL
ncbi:hypothetical protein PtB15_3B203 [Puccinia triticina]|nr:hypothetical protein PtB15_3B203 [Puccinia triticina]